MIIKTFAEAAAESTCLKRAIICELFDIKGELIARESNRCAPDNGICVRLSQSKSTKEVYPTESLCNWTHAEVVALASIDAKSSKPYRANIYGHRFACPACEQKLIEAGVKVIEIHE